MNAPPPPDEKPADVIGRLSRWLYRHWRPLLTLAGIVLTAAFTNSSLFVMHLRAPTRHPNDILPTIHRVSYTGSFAYRSDRWHVEESILVARADLPPTMQRRGQSPAALIDDALPGGWRVRPERQGPETSYRLVHKYTSPVLGVPAQRPLTKDIDIAARRFELLHRLFVPTDGSVLTLHAEEHRIRSTNPSSDAAPETDHREGRPVHLDATADGGLGAGVAVRMASNWGTSDWMPQEVVDATAAGWVRWVLGLLGVTFVVASKWLVRVLKWIWTGKWSSPAPAGGG
jgi:hypothetical protein